MSTVEEVEVAVQQFNGYVSVHMPPLHVLLFGYITVHFAA